jgi:hypothetical protein
MSSARRIHPGPPGNLPVDTSTRPACRQPSLPPRHCPRPIWRRCSTLGPCRNRGPRKRPLPGGNWPRRPRGCRDASGPVRQIGSGPGPHYPIHGKPRPVRTGPYRRWGYRGNRGRPRSSSLATRGSVRARTLQTVAWLPRSCVTCRYRPRRIRATWNRRPYACERQRYRGPRALDLDRRGWGKQPSRPATCSSAKSLLGRAASDLC